MNIVKLLNNFYIHFLNNLTMIETFLPPNNNVTPNFVNKTFLFALFISCQVSIIYLILFPDKTNIKFKKKNNEIQFETCFIPQKVPSMN